MLRINSVCALMAALLTCCLAVFTPAPAAACTFVAPDVLRTDPALAASDNTPPNPARILETQIIRGTHSLLGGDSCDGTGQLSLRVESPGATAPVGFAFAVARGSLPVQLPVEPLLTRKDGWISFVWSDAQEPFEAQLSVVAVDEAGNRAEPALVDLADTPGCGCAAHPAGVPSIAAVAAGLGALILSARKRPTVRDLNRAGG